MLDATQKTFELLTTLEEKNLQALEEYLRIPSVSTDPAYRDDVRRCAEFLLEKMKSAGLDARLIEASDAGVEEGHPMVYGEWLGAPGKPTVLFYGHYDVQPPDPLDEWRSPPFEPTREGDHLVARGATDDKGQSLTHLAAVTAVLAERGALPVNVKFLVEGEEEGGGETIETFVRGNPPTAENALLAADCVVVSDTSMLGPGQPSMLYGLKGLLYAQIDVSGPNRDLHSGSFGGAVQNPANALASLVASLRDPATGRVLIEGFYDDVKPLQDWERESFASVPFDPEGYRDDLGVPELFGEEGYTTRERTWGRPTCDVNGMWSGYQGEGAKTIIPASAGAKVSMRLVPGQDPEAIQSALAEHLEKHAPLGVEVKLTVLGASKPVLIDVEGPIAEAGEKAMAEVWGAAPIRVREGGSIPIVGTFDDVLGVPILLLGFGLSNDRLHSPNEKFNISHFFGGIRSIVAFLDRLSEV